jgi:hypothetical protein
MTNKARDEEGAGGSSVESGEAEGFDPRDTEHPTGWKQAAENAANDPPS